ncbi:MAG TPA: Gfo/Idh/MocA family oxidoreductase [Chitinophagaceae bacterium]|nr:Gfo/Idh/MocA family oxidoreductase [Chitinophagaceae bacterium]
MSSPIKTGLVGFGVAGKFMHAPFLKVRPEYYNIVSVLERHDTASKALFPGAQIVHNMDELLATDIDLVIITTPNDTHLPYTKQALLAGKNVVLEKPFTINTADAKELIDLAKAQNKILSVFHNRRYVTDFLTIKEIIGQKLLGDVHDYEAHYDRYRPAAKPNAWREEPLPGSGIWYDLGAHIIDQALYLFGLPATITATIKNQRSHARATDYFDVRLDYGFLSVTLKSGMLVREQGPRYIIHGIKGSFLKYGEDPQEVYLRAGKLPTEVPNWGIESEEFCGLLHTEINGEEVKKKYPTLKGDYGFYYDNLYNTIVNGAELREKPEHGYNTIRIVELGLESNEKKCTIPCTGLIDVKYPW